MKKYLFICLLFLITVSSVFAQLSGSYTAGQPMDDFPDLNDAIYALKTQGMDGTVQLLLVPVHTKV